MMKKIYGFSVLLVFAGFLCLPLLGQISLPGSEPDKKPPVKFEILKKGKLKSGDETNWKISFIIEEGYHINLIPPFTIKVESKTKDVKFIAKPRFDKEKLKEARQKVSEGESVYLDISKPHTFAFLAEGKPAGGNKVGITWRVTLFYCSDADGLCFRKVLQKTDTLTFVD